MVERPILFSTEMVKALMAGRKSQTRRIAKPQPSIKMGVGKWIKNAALQMIGDYGVVVDYMKKNNPYGQPGDILWVRETMIKAVDGFTYWPVASGYKKCSHLDKVVPSIHMPKSACRIRLEITKVRVERLQEITEEDAIAEGVTELAADPISKICRWCGQHKNQHIGTSSNPCFGNPTEFFDNSTYVGGYKNLWEKINGPQSWTRNPWVWVIEFHVKQ